MDENHGERTARANRSINTITDGISDLSLFPKERHHSSIEGFTTVGRVPLFDTFYPLSRRPLLFICYERSVYLQEADCFHNKTRSSALSASRASIDAVSVSLVIAVS